MRSFLWHLPTRLTNVGLFTCIIICEQNDALNNELIVSADVEILKSLNADKSKNVVGNEVKVWITVTHLCIILYDTIWKSFYPFKENLSIYMSWNSISIDDLDITYYIGDIIILVKNEVWVTLSNWEQVIKIEVDSFTLW